MRFSFTVTKMNWIEHNFNSRAVGGRPNVVQEFNRQISHAAAINASFVGRQFRCECVGTDALYECKSVRIPENANRCGVRCHSQLA